MKKLGVFVLMVGILLFTSCLSSGGSLVSSVTIISSEIDIPEEINTSVEVNLLGPARDGSAMYANPGGLDVSITNNSESIIKVLWSKSSFLSPDGQSHVIMLTGMKYGDAGKAPPDSIIPAGSFTRAQAFYAENVYFGSYTFMKPIPTSSTKLLICMDIDGKEYYCTIDARFGKKS